MIVQQLPVIESFYVDEGNSNTDSFSTFTLDKQSRLT